VQGERRPHAVTHQIVERRQPFGTAHHLVAQGRARNVPTESGRSGRRLSQFRHGSCRQRAGPMSDATLVLSRGTGPDAMVARPPIRARQAGRRIPWRPPARQVP
jgi:hypothetical protein